LSDSNLSAGGLPSVKEAAGAVPALPRPDEISSRERDDAMGSYLMMFASLGLGLPLPLFNIIASAIYYFINRKTSRFVAFHALQAFLFHIPVSLFNAASLVWIVIVLFGEHFIPTSFFVFCVFTGLLNLAFIIYSLIALVRARRGLFFYIPIFGRLAFDRHYGEKKRRERPERRNEAPRGYWG
jgi:uncharacterized membrane protein